MLTNPAIHSLRHIKVIMRRGPAAAQARAVAATGVPRGSKQCPQCNRWWAVGRVQTKCACCKLVLDEDDSKEGWPKQGEAVEARAVADETPTRPAAARAHPPAADSSRAVHAQAGPKLGSTIWGA